MADRQTTGGYPQIATVITADLPLAGQLAPGDWIEFDAVHARRGDRRAGRAGSGCWRDAVLSRRLQADVPLAPLQHARHRRPARWFAARDVVRATSPRAHGMGGARGVPLFVLGGGSNLVIADDGFDGLVLQVALRGVAVVDRRWRHVIVTAGAGEAVGRAGGGGGRRADSPGIECLSGIPGTVGGTPIQNVGAYGQEVADIDRIGDGVRSLARQRWSRFRRADCGFAYRMSRFKRHDAGRFVVCEVTFRLRPGRADGHLSRRRRVLSRAAASTRRRSPTSATPCWRFAAARAW